MRRSSAQRFSLFWLILLTLALGYGSCGFQGLFERAGDLIEDIVTPKTTRENFRNEISRDGFLKESFLDRWDESFAAADTQGLKVALPHREVFVVDSTAEQSAQAIHFDLPPGRLLTIAGEGDGSYLFGELYKAGVDGRRQGRPLAEWTLEQPTIDYETGGRTEPLLFVFQPQPGTRVSAQITLTTSAALLFPVAGKDQRAIGSFWGASRDGGRRSHKGNDVFAPRGTPLLAVTDGKIYKVGNGGLGGKTVWLHDRARNQSYYYAHLDSQYVSRGQYVQRGDTLGTVGNTGNARTTPPHLHFGVYARGAYDPFPLLQGDDETPSEPDYQLSFEDINLAVPQRGNHYLRELPDRKGKVLRQLENGEQVRGLGATGRFYRVVTGLGEYGYVNFD